MKSVTALMVLLCVALTPAAAVADLDGFDFTGKVEELRFRELVGKLRCLVCQNESLIGSQAFLAKDLREEIYTMMADGKDDQVIIDFMVARYGDFVLYDPPLRPSTYLLWFTPFVLLFIAGVILVNGIKRRNRHAQPMLTDNDRKRIDALLDGTDGRPQDE